MYNLPAHKNCTNCGDCCGMIPASVAEVRQILGFLAKHSEAKAVASKVGSQPLHCPFRDDKNKRCAIYPVRPIVCRMFGVCANMSCKNGNTAELDGSKFLGPDHSIDRVIVLNFFDWRAQG